VKNEEMDELVAFLRKMPEDFGSKKVRVLVEFVPSDRDKIAQIMQCLTKEQRAAITWEEKVGGTGEEIEPKEIVRRGQA
jgi:hypothetical protein